MRRKARSPRAAHLQITLTMGMNETRHALELPDFKGSVTGGQFKPEYLIAVLKDALAARFGGQVNELP